MLGYGFANAFSQKLVRSLGPALMLFWRGLVMVVVLAVGAVVDWHHLGSWPVVLAAVGLGMAGYLPVLAFSHGLKESRLGVVAPIAGTSPLITVLLAAAFLGSPVAVVQWVAIGLVVIANIAVSVDVRNWRDSKVLQRSSGIAYALAAAVGWGIFFFAMVPLSRALGPWVSAWAAEVGVTAAAGLHLLAMRPLVRTGVVNWRGIVVNGLLTCVGTVAFTVGVRYFNVEIVAVLGNSTALVGVLLGSLLLGERLHLKEKASVVVMMVGVAIISLFRA